jgi:hypothetical protein
MLSLGMAALVAGAYVTAEDVGTLTAAPPEDLETTVPSERPLRLGRAFLESGLLFGLNTAWYWRPLGDQDTRDWDLRFDWASWKRKMITFDALRFDSSRMSTNVGEHPFAGAGHYQIARANGFGAGAAFIWSFVASWLWEYFSEFREYPSVNDLIFTPVGGLALGEAGFRLGEFLAAGDAGLAGRVGTWLFSPFAAFGDAVDRRPPDPRARAWWHDLGAEAGAVSSQFGGTSREELSLGAHSTLIATPTYHRPTRARAGMRPGDWTDLNIGLMVSQAGIGAFSAGAQTSLAGLCASRFADGGDGRIRGWGMAAALASGLEYTFRDLGGNDDAIGSAQLLGARLLLDAQGAGWSLRFTASSYYALSLVQSLAYADHRGDFVGGALKTELVDYGYYYAHSWLSDAVLTLEHGPVSAGVGARLGLFRSIDMRDRNFDRLQGDIWLSDQRIDVAPWIAARVDRWLTVGVRAEHIARHSHVPDHETSAPETRLGLWMAVGP